MEKETGKTDAARVRDLLDEWKKTHDGGQSEFARRYAMPGGSSMISQHKSGHRPLSLAHAKAYMAGFGCTLADLSPALAAEVSGVDGPHGAAENVTIYEPLRRPAMASPTLAQCVEVLSLHLNAVPQSERAAAAALLSALVSSPFLHASVAAGIEKLILSDKSQTAAAA